MTDPERLLRTGEIAQAFDVAPATVTGWATAGLVNKLTGEVSKCPHGRNESGSQRRFNLQEVLDWKSGLDKAAKQAAREREKNSPAVKRGEIKAAKERLVDELCRRCRVPKTKVEARLMRRGLDELHAMAAWWRGMEDDDA